MLAIWREYWAMICTATGCASWSTSWRGALRQRREARLLAEQAQASTIDQLRAVGVAKFKRQKPATRRGAGALIDDTVGYLGDLRFIVGAHGSIQLEGYIDPDKAQGLAKLYR